jgi:uncharacterized protein YkwD
MMTGRGGRPYAALALLAGALLVAGAGAALQRPVVAGSSAAAGQSAARLGGEVAASATAPPTGQPATPSERPSRPPSPAPAPSPAAPRPSTARPSPSLSRVERLENEVTALVNQERARAGCAAVHTDERLRTAARRHSADMAAQNYFSHTSKDGSTPWDRMRRAGYDDGIAENIAYGYPTPAEVMRGWMASSGHRANILNCAARAIGVGLAYSAGGTPYWTQDFGSV